MSIVIEFYESGALWKVAGGDINADMLNIVGLRSSASGPFVASLKIILQVEMQVLHTLKLYEWPKYAYK